MLSTKCLKLDNPLVSVVITTFKRPVHLRRAIISVLNQEYSNFEIVVVDDNDEGSAERRHTEQIISGFSDSRLHYVLHDRNLGANVARNTGARHSKGDYIAFLDDDDEFLSNKLSRQIDVALRFGSSNGVLVFCGFEVIGNTRLNKSRWHNNVGSNLFFPSFPELYSGNFIGSNSFVLIDKISFDRIGGYDEKLVSSQDWDFYLQLSKAGVLFVGIPQVLVRYNAFDASVSITGDNERRIQGFLEIERKHAHDASEVGPNTLKSFYRYLFRRTFSIKIPTGIYFYKKLFVLTSSVRDIFNLFIDLLYALYHLVFYFVCFLRRIVLRRAWCRLV